MGVVSFLSIFVSASIIIDHKNHPHDVIAGMIMGGAAAHSMLRVNRRFSSILVSLFCRCSIVFDILAVNQAGTVMSYVIMVTLLKRLAYYSQRKEDIRLLP